MIKFIIPLALLASIFLAKTVTSQPYCVCPNPNLRPICVPGPPPKDLKQVQIPQCYCDGPYYPVCSQWKESNVTSEVDKIPSPSVEENNQSSSVCICPAIWQPVCACNAKEQICKTFGNICSANCAKTWCIVSNGECGKSCPARPPSPPAGV